MKDFRIVNAKAILNVLSVSPIRNFVPPSVAVTGEKLDRADEVLFNGVRAEEFIVSSPNRLVVRIPPSQVGQNLESLSVLGSVSSTRTNALVSFGLGRPARSIEGIDRLVQMFLMVLYSNPSSDIFDKTSGGGALGIVGRNTSDGGNVAADLTQALERTREELLRVQSANPRIPPSERLLTAELKTINFDPDSSSVSARISLQNTLSENAELMLR